MQPRSSRREQDENRRCDARDPPRLARKVDGDFRLLPAGGDAPQAALPPPVNRFDLDVRWGSLIRAVDWEHPNKAESALLAVHTRLSAILAAILSQGGDELQGGVLVVFYVVAVAFLVVGVAGLAIGISMSRSITGAVHALVCGNAAGDARRFFAFDPGVGARSAGRVERLVQHHDAESGAAAGGGERKRAHAGRDRDRAGCAGTAVPQGAPGFREPASAGNVRSGAHGVGRLLRLPVSGWETRASPSATWRGREFRRRY